MFSALGAEKKKKEETKKGKDMFAIMDTTKGKIKIKLFPDKAPKTVENFVGLAEGKKEWTDPKTHKKVKTHFYDGVRFHRVIDGFMIQAGRPKGSDAEEVGFVFDDEIDPSLQFDRTGLLAMANAGKPDGIHGTNSSQFFITVSKPSHLNGKHTIFGEVVEGYDVVEKIAKLGTAQDSNPKEEVLIKSVKIEKK